MRSETLAVHGGQDGDPILRACAVPIDHTVAYEFDSADHAAALFDLERPENRYRRIANPAFYDVLKLVKRLVNIGDTRTLARHPASTIHRQMSVAAQQAAGVTPDLIRISIGIEHVENIIDDLDQALDVSRRQCVTGAVAAYS